MGINFDETTNHQVHDPTGTTCKEMDHMVASIEREILFIIEAKTQK